LKPCGTCEDKRQKEKDKSADRRSFVFIATGIRTLKTKKFEASYERILIHVKFISI
jgi:hypothetical protein